MSGDDRHAVGATEAERDDGDGAHGDPILARTRAVLEDHWTTFGYCVPNPTTYPWLWLWDSCFHAICWAHLGDERAVVELDACLADIDDDGFVPHMRYVPDPGFHADFWGRVGTSSITQPPMYGHAVATLVRLGFDVPGSVADRAGRGLRFLLDRRVRSRAGLVTVVHPWETGCDDSPRWDHWRPTPEPARWRERKGTFLDTIERTGGGAPVANRGFSCAPAGFSALVAWNGCELAAVTGDEMLRRSCEELADAVDARWDGRTWVDDGDHGDGSGRIRTLDALLPALLGGPHALAAVDQLEDPATFAGAFGPRGVAADEPSHDPSAYWRGPVWPQLAYLVAMAAERSGADGVASSVSAATVAGALASDWAEYWNPDDGTGLGARPQSWTGIVAALPGR